MPISPVTRQKLCGDVKSTPGARQLVDGYLEDVVQVLENVQLYSAAPFCSRHRVAARVVEQEFVCTNLNGQRRENARNGIERRRSAVTGVGAIQISSRRGRQPLLSQNGIMGICVF